MKELDWSQYFWVYVFALAIGFSTTIAEPSLLAVALKAHQVSGGVIGVWGLRIAVAIGVAIGLTGNLPHYYRNPFALVHHCRICDRDGSNPLCP